MAIPSLELSLPELDGGPAGPTDSPGLNEAPGLSLDGPVPDLGLDLDLPSDLSSPAPMGGSAPVAPPAAELPALDPPALEMPALDEIVALPSVEGPTAPEPNSAQAPLPQSAGLAQPMSLSQGSTAPSTPVPRPPSGAQKRPGLQGSRRRRRAKKQALPPRLVAVVVGTLFLAAAGVLMSRPTGDVPQFPNPLRERVKVWSEAGSQACEDCGALQKRVDAALDSGDQHAIESNLGDLRALLIQQPDNPRAVAAFVMTMAMKLFEPDPALMRDAAGALVSARIRHPNNARLIAAEAWLRLREGKLDAARRAAEECRGRTGGELGRVAGALTAVDSAPDRALDLLDDGPEVNPRWHRRVVLLTDFHLGRHDELRRATRELLEAQPIDDFSLRQIAKLEMFSSRYKAAEDIFSALQQAGLLSVDDALLWARTLGEDRGQTAAARAVLAAALEQPGLAPPERARLLAERVGVEAMSGALDAPANVFSWVDAGLDHAPDYAPLMHTAGLADALVDEQARALESHEVAFELDPSSIEAAFMYAHLRGRDDVEEARQAVKAALTEQPRSIVLWLLKGKFEMERDDRVGALDAISRAWEIDPRESRTLGRFDAYPLPAKPLRALENDYARWARSNKNSMFYTAAAMVAYAAGNRNRASQHINAALKLDREAVGGRLYRAILRIDAGDLSKSAEKDLDVVLEQDSAHRLAKLYRARVLEKRKPSVSARLYREILDRNSQSLAAHIGLARCLTRDKQGKKAQESLIRAIQLGAYHPEVLEFLGG